MFEIDSFLQQLLFSNRILNYYFLRKQLNKTRRCGEIKAFLRSGAEQKCFNAGWLSQIAR